MGSPRAYGLSPSAIVRSEAYSTSDNPGAHCIDIDKIFLCGIDVGALDAGTTAQVARKLVNVPGQLGGTEGIRSAWPGIEEALYGKSSDSCIRIPTFLKSRESIFSILSSSPHLRCRHSNGAMLGFCHSVWTWLLRYV